MPLGIVIGRSPRGGRVGRSALAARLAALLDRIGAIVSACTQAADAAHSYERLRYLSDEALADRGLRRQDIPRAAFKMLS